MDVRSKIEKRGSTNQRERRKIILIGCEGNNKTEKLYFLRFNNEQKKFNIKFIPANYTDSYNIYKSVKKEFKKSEYDKNNDYAFCLFDLDSNKDKVEKYKITLEESKETKIKLIPSNLCFEIWYLMHFIFSTKEYINSNELLKVLNKYIDNYKKDEDVFDILYSKINNAISNINKLNESYNPGSYQSSFTYVNKIVELLIDET